MLIIILDFIFKSGEWAFIGIWAFIRINMVIILIKHYYVMAVHVPIFAEYDLLYAIVIFFYDFFFFCTY